MRRPLSHFKMLMKSFVKVLKNISIYGLYIGTGRRVSIKDPLYFLCKYIFEHVFTSVVEISIMGGFSFVGFTGSLSSHLFI